MEYSLLPSIYSIYLSIFLSTKGLLDSNFIVIFLFHTLSFYLYSIYSIYSIYLPVHNRSAGLELHCNLFPSHTIYLYIFLYIYLSICLSIYLLSIRLSIYLSSCPQQVCSTRTSFSSLFPTLCTPLLATSYPIIYIYYLVI